MITRHKFLDKNTTPYILIHLYFFFLIFSLQLRLSSFQLWVTIPTANTVFASHHLLCRLCNSRTHPSGHQPLSSTPSISSTPSTTIHTRLQIKSPFLSSPQTHNDRPSSSPISLMFSHFSASLFYRSLSYANFSLVTWSIEREDDMVVEHMVDWRRYRGGENIGWIGEDNENV